MANEKIAHMNQLANQTLGLFDIITGMDQSEGDQRRRDYNNQISFNIEKMYKIFDEFYSSSANQSLTGQFTGFELAIKDETGSSLLKTVMRKATTDDIFDDSGKVPSATSTLATNKGLIPNIHALNSDTHTLRIQYE